MLLSFWMWLSTFCQPASVQCPMEASKLQLANQIVSASTLAGALSEPNWAVPRSSSGDTISAGRPPGLPATGVALALVETRQPRMTNGTKRFMTLPPKRRSLVAPGRRCCRAHPEGDGGAPATGAMGSGDSPRDQKTHAVF